MRARTKKLDSGKVSKIDAYGGVKEVIVKEDIFDSENNLIEVCFKGENSSGIIELSVEEIDMINSELEKSKKQVSKMAKKMKFKK